MSRLPVLNLIFVLVLITILAIQHSASVFAPGENAIEPVSYDPAQVLNSGPLTVKSEMAVDYLRDLWGRAMIIKEWTIEYRTTAWERMFAPRGAERDLIEARFHVANAEAFGSATGEIQKAENELERADRFLQNALPLVTDKLLPTLMAIRKELTDAKMELQSGPDTASDEQIKADLDWMIASLHGKRL